MKIINYEIIKDKIKNYCNSKLFVELYIEEQEKKEKILCEVFNKKSIKETIGAFKYIKLDDVIILEYKTINESNNRVINNLVLVGNNNNVLKVEHYEPLKNLMYKEDVISIYENMRLTNKIYTEKINFATRVKILEIIKGANYYNKKDYTFYNDDKETNSLRVNNEMYIKDENGFTSALNTATNYIKKISTKISDKVDEMLGLEIMKEYIIIRKKRGQ